VELVGAYSNLSRQKTFIAELLKIVPVGPVRDAPPANRQVQRRLHEPEIDELVTSYLEGSTVYELAQQFSIHRHTVSEVLERREVSRRYRKLSPDQLRLACTLYEEGLSLTKVGQRLGRRAETVRQALMKAGAEIRPRNG
jgi:DNA-directed RNA polymerase specialized sigma24 family protein